MLSGLNAGNQEQVLDLFVVDEHRFNAVRLERRKSGTPRRRCRRAA